MPDPPPAPFVDIIGPSFSSRRDDDGKTARGSPMEPVGDNLLSAGMPPPMRLGTNAADDVATGALPDAPEALGAPATRCAPFEPSGATPAATPRASSDGSGDEMDEDVMEAPDAREAVPRGDRRTQEPTPGPCRLLAYVSDRGFALHVVWAA